MEFDVRVVGGIESCYVSLPLSLIQTLQSSYLPPILAVELRSGANLWHVAWSGSLSSSSPSSIEIAKQYADCIGLSDRTVVKVRIVSNLLKATLVTVEPLTEDDWEILELNSELAEEAILKQVGIVHEEMKFPLWLHGQTIVNFLVVSTFPKKPVVQLVPGTEVAVAPKRRKRILDPLEDSSIQALKRDHSITKALLRVQNSDSRFHHNYKVDGIKMDVVFTSAVFIHPETAKKYSFSSSQLVMISPRILTKESKKNHETAGLHIKSSSTEKEVNGGILADKHDNHRAIVCLLFSESVARGHVMLAQSLRLYLGAGLHSWVDVKRYNINAKKDVPSVSVSPCQLKSFPKKQAFANNGAEFQNGHNNHKTKDVLLRTNTNAEMGAGGWSTHEKIFASLFAESCGNGTEEIDTRARTKTAVSTLVHAWCQAQLDSIVSSTGLDINSLVIGNKSLIHLKVKGYRLANHGNVQKPNGHFPKTRNQTEEPDVDVLYVLSLFDDSLHGESLDAYELVFDEKSREKSSLRNLDVLLEKLQLGDTVSIRAVQETPSDRTLGMTVSSLDWMGSAASDVNNRLTALLSPTSGMLFSTYNLPRPGHILIYGPPGSGKTLLARVSATSIEGHEDILAHIVFVSCSRLALEKPPSIRQALSGYISEALDHSPSVIILDDLDSIVASSLELEGSQPSSSSAALIEFLNDILDEYEEKIRTACGIGPIAFIACVQSLTNIPQSLSSSGRFDFHVKLPAPGASERSALLKHEIQKRSLQCSDDVLLDIASKCDGYDAYDLEILVDRSVHAAIGRFLSTDLSFPKHEKPALVRDDFLLAMDDFLPIAMRDITKPSKDGGRSGWEDVGGLDDIQNSIKEIIELPSKFPNIFKQSPLRMRSNVLLYGPPGCGKTHIVGAAAAACSLRFISVKGPELLNKYIGASEQAVRDIFLKAAAAAPCLLFFDEFDSIAPKRGHDNTGVTDRVVNQFLTELDGVEVLTGVFVFAATSRPDLLDAALLRPGRLDRLLFCDFPSQRERLDILAVLSRKLPLANDVNLDAIARVTEGFSGADLQALLSDAQLEAVHYFLDSENGSNQGKTPVITDALLKSIASNAKPSVSEAEKRRLYDIYSQFLDSKRSAAAQSRDAKGKRATLA